jgi:hypothetical protein
LLKGANEEIQLLKVQSFKHQDNFETLKRRMQEIPENRKIVKTLEHQLKFLEMDTLKSFEVSRVTSTEHKRQINEANKHIQLVENMFITRDFKNKELEAMMFEQRDEI